jgi:hypothetical protein
MFVKVCFLLLVLALCACVKPTTQSAPPVSYANLSDFQVAAASPQSASQLCIQPGLLAVGNNAMPAAIGGCITFSGGSGDAKIYLDEDGQLVTAAAVGISHSAATAQMTFQNVATPAFPDNAIPVCDLTITDGVYKVDQCGMASRVRLGVLKAGAGLTKYPENGKVVIGLDAAQVCLLGGDCNFVGSVNASRAAMLVLPSGAGPPPAATCAADRVGSQYVDSATGGLAYTCLHAADGSYAWTAAGASGAPQPPPSGATITGKPPIVVKPSSAGTDIAYGFSFRSSITADKYEITAADCGYALRFSRDGPIAVSLPLLPFPCALMLASIKSGPVNVSITQTAPDGSGGDFNGDRTFSLGRHHGAIMHVNQSSAFWRGVYTCRAGYCAGAP